MKAIKVNTLSCKLLLAVCLLCATCRAFCDLYHSRFNGGLIDNFEQFGGLSNFNALETQLVPVYLMIDNEKLFMAAAAEKDISMNMMNRIMNNQWLAHRGQLNRADTRELEAFLRRNVVSFIRTDYSPTVDDEPRYEGLNSPGYKDYSQFKDINNYRLDVSDDEVNLRFYFAFN